MHRWEMEVEKLACKISAFSRVLKVKSVLSVLEKNMMRKIVWKLGELK